MISLRVILTDDTRDDSNDYDKKCHPAQCHISQTAGNMIRNTISYGGGGTSTEQSCINFTVGILESLMSKDSTFSKDWI